MLFVNISISVLYALTISQRFSQSDYHVNGNILLLFLIFCYYFIPLRLLISLLQAKARLQVIGSPYRGPWDVLLQAMRQQQPNGGIRSLYRGFGTVLVGGTPGTMLYLCSYEFIKERMGGGGDNNNTSFVVHFFGGMLAEAIACIIYVPVDVLKERMQVSNTYRNTWHGLAELWNHEGIRGVYRGYGATLASFGPFSAFYFVFYEKCKSMAAAAHLDKNKNKNVKQQLQKGNADLPFSSTVLCSCTAGALASWLTSPLDMAKLRLQVQRSSPIQGDTTMVQILGHVLKNDGVRGLFRGAGARVLHFAPATTITMTAYETCRSFFAKHI